MLILDAPITIGLIVANVLLSMIAFSNHRFLGQNLFIVGPILQDNQYHRLVTSGFLHADQGHLFFNMLTLFFFGPYMELTLGPTGYVMMYTGALLGGSLWSLVEHRRELHYSALGASGAISGVLVSYCLFAPFSLIFIYFIPVPAMLYAIVYIGYSAFASVNNQSRIGHDAHFGGAIAGILVTLVLRPDAWGQFVGAIENTLGFGS